MEPEPLPKGKVELSEEMKERAEAAAAKVKRIFLRHEAYYCTVRAQVVE